jgi:hypothetical protein
MAQSSAHLSRLAVAHVVSMYDRRLQLGVAQLTCHQPATRYVSGGVVFSQYVAVSLLSCGQRLYWILLYDE